MATFYYDSYSTKHIYSQWIKHLQSQEYIKDIGDIVSKNKRELQATIQNASAEHISAINKVCGNLDDGFGLISSHLNDIKFELGNIRGEINEMASMLDWKLSCLIEEQRITNQLLRNIIQLLRIPDSQKQRVYHIEQGLKYLKNAFLEDSTSTFFDDALESFEEAKKIERKDFITLNRIGLIYLYSSKNLNIPLAEEYFLKSARESFAEFNVEGTTTANNLAPRGYELLINSNDIFKAATAEAYLYASRTCYLQQKLPEAINFAGKAYDIIPQFVEAGFEKAKYLAANKQDGEAVKVLEIVIRKDRYYSVKTLSDKDLITNPLVLKLLDTIQLEASSKAKIGYNECKKIMRIESKAKQILSKIEDSISKNSFLSYMDALDLLNGDHRIPYNNYSRNRDYSDNYTESINKNIINEPIKILELIKKENYNANLLESLKLKIRKKIVVSRTFIGLGLGLVFGFVAGIFRGCTLSNLSLDGQVWLNTLIVCTTLGVIIGVLIGFSKEIEIN